MSSGACEVTVSGIVGCELFNPLTTSCLSVTPLGTSVSVEMFAANCSGLTWIELESGTKRAGDCENDRVEKGAFLLIVLVFKIERSWLAGNS